MLQHLSSSPWDLCCVNTMTDSALRTKVSPHSRCSAQFPNISGIPAGIGAPPQPATLVWLMCSTPPNHQRRCRDELGGLAHDHKYIPCGQAKPWSRRRHFCRPPGPRREPGRRSGCAVLWPRASCQRGGSATFCGDVGHTVAVGIIMEKGIETCKVERRAVWAALRGTTLGRHLTRGHKSISPLTARTRRGRSRRRVIANGGAIAHHGPAAGGRGTPGPTSLGGCAARRVDRGGRSPRGAGARRRVRERARAPPREPYPRAPRGGGLG